MKQMLSLLVSCLFCIPAFCQTIEGKWVNYKNGKPEVLVELYETSSGEFEGKVIKIYQEDVKTITCDKCDEDDPRYNKPLLGMVVFKGLEPNEDYTKAENGTFLHTKSGKTYKTFIELQDDPDKLDVRGYIGMKAIGKTYTWTREE